jgi:NadR type nicotinamide-nucleotide adenylyltransferase
VKTGVIAGKFLPPHLGHSYLIDTAARQCDKLTVLICDRPEYPIPAKLRRDWLAEIHPNVDFRIIKDRLDDDDSPGWARMTIKLLGGAPDAVFSSEAYGERWAKYMGCRHVMVDQPRRRQPISATDVRANPWANWQFLHPVARAYFTKRFVVIGAESSGTTTLAEALAKHYQTEWVPEYGRDYSEIHPEKFAGQPWRTKDFVTIAHEQNRLEDELAKKANKMMFCDTDSFATIIWHERYVGKRSWQVEKIAAGRPYELYFLTDASIPFVQDGLRDGEHQRQWMQQRFEEKLRFWCKPYVIISGNHERRLKQATAIIDKIMAGKDSNIPGLQQNFWQPL